jgi:hypothetical protein
MGAVPTDPSDKSLGYFQSSAKTRTQWNRLFGQKREEERVFGDD